MGGHCIIIKLMSSNVLYCLMSSINKISSNLGLEILNPFAILEKLFTTLTTAVLILTVSKLSLNLSE